LPTTASTADDHQGFLYGRVTTDDGATCVGRLRFGRDEEAVWGDYFNGFKDNNPWAARSQVAELTQKRRAFMILGFEVPLGGLRSISAGPSWRASATSRASRRAAATCG
jgi:hypothetical protein